MPIVESTVVDHVIVNWKDIFTEQKVWKTKYFNNNMVYKLKLHKMKIDIK